MAWILKIEIQPTSSASQMKIIKSLRNMTTFEFSLSLGPLIYLQILNIL